ncbi:arginine deiminase-related protein [Shimia thalassica]|uniref:citrulline utilization hydrolase CtlX n=1 Tax=Shimia thalassica TaxID=1715693 RepID=UPI000C076752|nr:arginine deiminase-related protein [Shimia thalassica]MDO6521414.1 arginine deiminase-related protein [Shimia thalassica]MDP2518631.1 arginine deiminase-related protein [Shimia thalassica]MDP2580336.1 arginine deiminase-related protein [Shimia thalassica]PHO03861.1 amidinotransferase [Rhodobacteraceae bacterium 4F10]
MKTLQAPDAVVMIRPHHFCSNPETRDDNAFQTLSNHTATATSEAARGEFDVAVKALRKAGVRVHVFDDTGKTTPDSVFPNNWFSTHTGGHVAIYPMFAPNRRLERRTDVIEMLKRDYRVQDVIDYSGLEQDGLALEGTGAMVLDHIGRIAYTVQSNRADPVLLERFCTHFNYEPIAFEARDAQGRDVYHTNVLMGIGTDYALICLDMIVDAHRRATVAQRLEESGRQVIDLTHAQIGEFAGNAIELTGDRRVLALSSRALRCLRPEQLAVIEKTAQPLPLDIPTIETAGGSVRCMLAGIHLTRRTERSL